MLERRLAELEEELKVRRRCYRDGGGRKASAALGSGLALMLLFLLTNNWPSTVPNIQRLA